MLLSNEKELLRLHELLSFDVTSIACPNSKIIRDFRHRCFSRTKPSNLNHV